MIVIGSTNLSSSLEAVAPVGSVAWLIPPPEADASDQEKRKAASVTVPNVQVYCENTKNKDVVGIITQSAPRRKDKSIVEATNLGVCVSGIATTQMDDSGNFVPGARLEVHLPPNQYLDIEQHRSSKWSSLRLKRVSRRKNNGGRLCFRSLGIRKRQQGQVMVALCSMPRGPQDVETESPDQPSERNVPDDTASSDIYEQQLFDYLRGLRSWPVGFESEYIDRLYGGMEDRGMVPGYSKWEPTRAIPASNRKQRRSIGYELNTEITVTNIAKSIDADAQQAMFIQGMNSLGEPSGSESTKPTWWNFVMQYLLSVFGIFGRRTLQNKSIQPQNLVLFILMQMKDRVEDEDPEGLLHLVLSEVLTTYWINQQLPRKPLLYAIPVVNNVRFMTVYLHFSYCVRFLYDWYVSHQDDVDSELYTVDQLTYCINMMLKAILILLNFDSSKARDSSSDDANSSSDDTSSSDDDRSSVASSDLSDSDSDSVPGLEGSIE